MASAQVFSLFLFVFALVYGSVRSQVPDGIGAPVCDCTDNTLRSMLTAETEIRNKLQERVAVLEQQILSLQSLGALTKGQYSSCRQILNEFPKAPSGPYTITTSKVGLVDVYCDMETNGGGYTFLPDSAITSGLDDQDMAHLAADRTDVLLKILVTDGSQPYTVVKQLPMFASIPLMVAVNNYTGYVEPHNVAYLGPYMYLGFLPSHVASHPNHLATQGFRSNEKDVTFTSCNGDINSYFAFFPNNKQAAPKNANYPEPSMYQAWRSSALPSHRLLPLQYFHFTEMHFGGCGIYSSSDKWVDVQGVAFGTR